MSWRCTITVDRAVLMKGVPRQQVSPLRFKTKEEAQDFGCKIFEPPMSVESWDIESTPEPTNFSYKGGKLQPFRG